MTEKTNTTPSPAAEFFAMKEEIKSQGEAIKSMLEMHKLNAESTTKIVEVFQAKSVNEDFEAKLAQVKAEMEAKAAADKTEMYANLEAKFAEEKKSVNVSASTYVKPNADVLEQKMYHNLAKAVQKEEYNPQEYKSIVDDYCDIVANDSQTSKHLKSAVQAYKSIVHNVTDYSLGGFATGAPLYLGAIQQWRQFSPLRELAQVQLGKDRIGYVDIIKASGRAEVQSTDDKAYTSSESISVSRKDVKAAFYTKTADVSDHLLNFATNPQGLINLINNDILGAIGQGMGEDYILGKNAPDGAIIESFIPNINNTFIKTKPLQYDVNINKVGRTVSGNPSTITADSIISIRSKLAPIYRANAVYYMNSNTRDAIFSLKGQDGHYIFASYVNGLSPTDTINGFKIVTDENMPDIAPNSMPIAFVDLSRYYKIYDALYANDGTNNGGLVEFMPRTQKSAVSNFIAKAFTAGFVNDSQAAVFLQISA